MSAGLIYKKIPELMPKIGAITKDRKSTQGQYGYMFRGVDDFINAAQRPFSESGVFLTTTVLSTSREERESKNGGNLIYTILDVKFTLYAEDGSNVTGITKGEAMDSGDKSCNKAMSAALKYFLRDTFMVPTEEDIDTENHTHEVKPKAVSTIKSFIPSSPGEYPLMFSTNTHKQGKKLKEFTNEELGALMFETRNYLNTLKEKNEKPRPSMVEFLDYAERYLEGK